MQKDSMYFSTPGHMMQDQAAPQESPVKFFNCSHCPLIFKSKAFFDEHLNNVHGFVVDAGVTGTNKANSDSSGSTFKCQLCDFKACNWDLLKKHEMCHNSSEDHDVKEGQIISENQSAGAKEISSSVMSTSETKCTVNLSSDLKTYKKPLQTVTTYFAASPDSNGKPSVKPTDNSVLLDVTRTTLFLQESPSNSKPNSNGVFKVTAKSMIDLSSVPHKHLLNDNLLIANLTPSVPMGQIKDPITNNAGKRTCNESSDKIPAKKIKAGTEDEKVKSGTKFSFEVSEDEEENSINLVNRDMESPQVYICKHCDYSDISFQSVSTHYQTDHPYVRYTSNYIQDPSNRSVTFRCLECPVEFFSVDDLKKHYTENHPEAPNLFRMQLCEVHLVFKCFVCPFTINTLKALRGHYREKHPTHKVNNSLMYCKYMVNKGQEGSSQLKTCEKTPSSETSERISTESGSILCEGGKNAPSPQHVTSKGADMALFHCNNCTFSHKSVVVMHVHYRKSHPEETVTIDKIKQSVSVTSQTTPEKTPESPNSVTIKAETSRQPFSKTHSESPETRKVESAEDRTRKTSTGMDSLSPTSPNKVFYCMSCSYSSVNVKSVVCHNNVKHGMHTQIGIQEILKYSADFRKKKCQREAEASANTSSPTSATELNAYARAEDLFYCNKCNYGNPSVKGVMNHQTRIHTGFKSSSNSIVQYTALICGEIEKSKSKAKTSPFSTNLPLPLMNDGDEHMFFCHFCNYRQNTVSQLLHHYYKTHCGFIVGAKQIRLHTSTILEQTQKLHLKGTANQEDNQASVGTKGSKKKPKMAGKCSSVSTSSSKILQCNRCTYSTRHMYLLRRHVRKTHRLHHSVSDVKMKGPQMKHTDGISDCDGTDGSLSGQNEAKIYPCRACSFKGHSMSSITHHYRAVHPWSVKEDGSVPDVVTNRKKPSASKQVENSSEIPESFDSYQVPLEFEKSPDSPHEATSFRCSHCPAAFQTQHGLNTHWGIKHQQSATEDLTRMHVFKCPHCTYVNIIYQGVLTHCQMKHPMLASKVDSLYVDDAHLRNWTDHLKRIGPDGVLRFRGYMCKSCLQIHATQEKLNKHCEEDHNETSAPTPTKTQQTHNPLGSPGSSFNKRPYESVKCSHCSYSCTTKIGLGRHLLAKHKNAPVSPAQDSVYKCVICTKRYFKKKHLEYHYTKVHGKDAFLKYYAPVYQNVPKKPASTPPDQPSTLEAECISKACQSSTATEKNKVVVFKCPSCPYVNASHHGTLTHCQMKHPDLVARTDELQTTEVLVTNMVACTLGKGYNERGYMCKKCPQIYPSLNILEIHLERDHNQAETEEQPLSMDDDPEGTKHKDPTRSATEIDPSHQKSATGKEGCDLTYRCSMCCYSSLIQKHLASHYMQKHGKEAFYKHYVKVHQQTRKRPQIPSSVQNKYKCDLCVYTGMERRYLCSHYKKYHRLDALTIYKRLQKYNKRKQNVSDLPEAESQCEESAQIKCKKCPNLFFDSFELLIAHYSTFHSSDYKLDFTVVYPVSRSSTGVYKCRHCEKQLNGIRKLCVHLDHHRESHKKREDAAKKLAARTKASSVEAKSTELSGRDEPSALDTEEETVGTFISPTSPSLSPSKPADQKQPEPESREDKHTCKQCVRTFMSQRGLRCHERSHAAVAAIKKLDNLPTSVLKHNIKKYLLLKSGTIRPFQCRICFYRTTVMGLWKSHFMKNHQDAITDPAEAEIQDENTEMAEKDPPNSSEELNNLPEPDQEVKATIESLYLEPPDVQRQLNHYSLVAEAAASSKANMQENKLVKNRLLHCEFCSFTSEHLSSVRRHLLNRHGKKILRCKDCNFFTGLRKTLELHIKTSHSTNQSAPSHLKDVRCPFCLYQTKNKNNLIDHIILHRDERVVPIEVRRPKLSRYLQGIVFRCHKCTFTSGSAENLRLHMTRHDDVKPYKCRLCYFDCAQLCDLEAHLCDKHQVVRNHALVGQVSLDQREANVGKMPEEEDEPPSNLKHNDESENIETEEFVTSCDEVPPETLAVNSTRENIILQTEEPDQQQRQGGRKEYEESLTISSAFNLQYKNNANLNTAVPGQGPQERAQTEMFLTDAAKRREVENIVEPNVSEGNDADMHFEDRKDPEKEQMNESQLVLGDNAGSRMMLTQHREEAAEGSSAKYVRLVGKEEASKLKIKALQDKALNIEARVKDDVLRHVLTLNEGGSIRGIHRKKEQNVETKVLDNVLNQIILLNKEGSITLANHPKSHPEVRTEVTADIAKKNLILGNIGFLKGFTAQRHLLTLAPNCVQLKMSCNKQVDEKRLSPNRKEQVQRQTNCEKLTDACGAMPVLEKETLKEEPLGCCKEEEDQHFEHKQDGGGKVITENIESRCKEQEHEEGGGPKAADGAAEVRRSSLAEKKLFICEFCGRNLVNGSELERHIKRHGL
ncbi:hypothetical protein PAMA_018051 [Pampus argenteus]